MAFDVAVIGGGIIGTAAAAYLAEAGRTVVLLEESELAAGASGRNSGVLQRPLESALASLYRDSLPLYQELAEREPSFEMPDQPAGLLLVSRQPDALAVAAHELAEGMPDLVPEVLEPAAARRLEPGLAEGVGACRVETGHPVVPAAATLAFARWAKRAGVAIFAGSRAHPLVVGGAVDGVALDSGERIAAGQVLVAAGPWSPALVPGWAAQPPIGRTYGVVASTQLDDPPRHVLEELGIDPATDRAPMSFSLVTAGGMSSVGSTFLTSQPDPVALAPHLMERGAEFVPALAGAQIVGLRSCARPISFDGRPLIGSLPQARGLYVCAGHGPWGLSTGPASARLVVSEMLDHDSNGGRLPSALAANRWPGASTTPVSSG